MLNRDAGDILDRYSIAKLKIERIGNEENKKEYEYLSKGYEELKQNNPNIPIDLLAKELYRINSTIWFLESAMKSGKENLPNAHYLDDIRNLNTLSVIGKNSILIRNINGLRVGIKNIVNRLLHEGFIDIKQNHMSAND